MDLKKISKIAFKGVKIFAYVLFFCFIISVCLQRFSKNEISIFNYRMFTVASGSMQPKYKIGDVLFSKDVSADKVKVGDAITYLGKTGDVANKVITHEVVKIEKDENNKYIFHTKGLTNLVEDPIVYEDQLYGVVIHKAILLSFVYKVISSPIGFYAFIIIPIMYIIGSEIIESALERKEKELNKRKKKIVEE